MSDPLSRKSEPVLIMEDAGEYTFPRPCCFCGHMFWDRAEYWAHRLAHEEARDATAA